MPQVVKNRTVTTVVVAASNSHPDAIAAADVQCSGTNDHTTIQNAIANMGTRGGRVLLRAGQYNFGGSCVIDRSYVDIQGEMFPAWGAFGGSLYLGTSVEGNATTKIKPSAGSLTMFTAGTTFPDNGENRHKGIRIAGLYFYGGNDTTGINLGSQHIDNCLIENNFFDLMAYAVRGSYDFARLQGNCVQNSLNGFNLSGYYLQITGNQFGDMGTGASDGTAIQLDSEATQAIIAHNSIVRVRGTGIKATYGAAITGNQISEACVNAIVVSAGDANPTPTTVTGNVITIGDNSVTSLGGNGIVIGTDAVTALSGVVVSGNAVRGHTSATGVGIDMRNATSCACVGNVVSGTWGGGAIKQGTGNTVANNVGAVS
jgi:hypothetical protein